LFNLNLTAMPYLFRGVSTLRDSIDYGVDLRYFADVYARWINVKRCWVISNSDYDTRREFRFTNRNKIFTIIIMLINIYINRVVVW